MTAWTYISRMGITRLGMRNSARKNLSRRPGLKFRGITWLTTG